MVVEQVGVAMWEGMECVERQGEAELGEEDGCCGHGALVFSLALCRVLSLG